MEKKQKRTRSPLESVEAYQPEKKTKFDNESKQVEQKKKKVKLEDLPSSKII